MLDQEHYLLKDEITLHDKKFIKYIPYEDIQKQIRIVGSKINWKYGESSTKPIVFIGVLNGAFMFLADLIKEMDHADIKIEVAFIKANSYTGTQPGELTVTGLDQLPDLKDKHVILVEDIIDTGNTINTIIDMLKDTSYASIETATLFWKKDLSSFIPTYSGFWQKGNQFIVGYGLDYDGLGRNLKDIYILES